MGNGFRRTVGVVVAGLAVASLLAGAPGAGAASTSQDVQLAKQGVLGTNDFPSDWSGAKPSGLSDAAVIKVASTVKGCSKYLALRKLSRDTPQASSLDFSDASRQVSNEVDVFSSPAKARAALALYSSPTVVPCLQRLFTKALTTGKVKDVTVTLAANPVGALGDQNIVYEGSAELTSKDGTTQQVGLGNAAVRVGRVVDSFTYTTTDASLTDVLQPAIDASLARIQGALGGSA